MYHSFQKRAKFLCYITFFMSTTYLYKSYTSGVKRKWKSEKCTNGTKLSQCSILQLSVLLITQIQAYLNTQQSSHISQSTWGEWKFFTMSPTPPPSLQNTLLPPGISCTKKNLKKKFEKNKKHPGCFNFRVKVTEDRDCKKVTRVQFLKRECHRGRGRYTSISKPIS